MDEPKENENENPTRHDMSTKTHKSGPMVVGWLDKVGGFQGFPRPKHR